MLMLTVSVIYSDMPRHKRPARRSDRVSTWNQPLTSGECCPSITRPTAPLGAISKDGRLLQLFRDANTVQKFYETECAPNVRDRACAFIDDSQWVSACRQKYTYTYAIVKDFNVTEPYRIDYMRIKSGCTCSISGPAKSLDQELREEAITKELLHELTAEYLEEKK